MILIHLLADFFFFHLAKTSVSPIGCNSRYKGQMPDSQVKHNNVVVNLQVPETIDCAVCWIWFCVHILLKPFHCRWSWQIQLAEYIPTTILLSWSVRQTTSSRYLKSIYVESSCTFEQLIIKSIHLKLGLKTLRKYTRLMTPFWVHLRCPGINIEHCPALHDHTMQNR